MKKGRIGDKQTALSPLSFVERATLPITATTVPVKGEGKPHPYAPDC